MSASSSVTRELLREELQAFAKEELSQTLDVFLQRLIQELRPEDQQGYPSPMGSPLFDSVKDPDSSSVSPDKSMLVISTVSLGGTEDRKPLNLRRNHTAPTSPKRASQMQIQKLKDQKMKTVDRTASKRSVASVDLEDSRASQLLRMPSIEDSPDPEDLEKENSQLILTGEVEPPRRLSSFVDFQILLAEIVDSAYFSYMSCLLVLLNAFFIGIGADLKVQNPEEQPPSWLTASDKVFCACFTLELIMRLVVSGLVDFFTMSGWAWNWFDCLVVTTQLGEYLLEACMDTGGGTAGLMNILRILRLVRILRLARVLNLIEDLRAITSSISGSLRSLFWTLVLLMMVMYSCGVCITQIVADHLAGGAKDQGHETDLKYYYGTLSRTVLSLFESIAGGQSWDCMLEPLISEVSPLTAPFFCMYVSFIIFAIFNSVTGVFCEKAMQSVQEEKEAHAAQAVRDAFERDVFKHHPENRMITLEEFEKAMVTDEVRDYFQAIQVDVSGAPGIFEMLDAEKAGEVDFDEFMSGICRFQGTAKSLDLALLTHEVNMSFVRVENHICQMLTQMGYGTPGAAGAPGNAFTFPSTSS